MSGEAQNVFAHTECVPLRHRCQRSNAASCHRYLSELPPRLGLAQPNIHHVASPDIKKKKKKKKEKRRRNCIKSVHISDETLGQEPVSEI